MHSRMEASASARVEEIHAKGDRFRAAPFRSLSECLKCYPAINSCYMCGHLLHFAFPKCDFATELSYEGGHLLQLATRSSYQGGRLLHLATHLSYKGGHLLQLATHLSYNGRQLLHLAEHLSYKGGHLLNFAAGKCYLGWYLSYKGGYLWYLSYGMAIQAGWYGRRTGATEKAEGSDHWIQGLLFAYLPGVLKAPGD